MNKLKIVSTSESSTPTRKSTGKVEREAIYERLWLQHPEEFDPSLNLKKQEQERRLLQILPTVSGAKGIDLGCGWGNVAKCMLKKGMIVDALDISSRALSRIDDPGIRKIKGTIPNTTLEVGEYDLVVAANLIAEIPENERRLAVSEMADLLKSNGIAVISTPIDIESEDGLIRFVVLLETEFIIEHLEFSYFYLAIKFPILKKSKTLLAWSEKISEFIWQDHGISDVIAICKRKPLFQPPVEPVQERATKKTVWE